MRNEPNVKAEKWRKNTDPSTLGRNCGHFEPVYRDGPFGHTVVLRVIVGNGGGWDHVSVSLQNRCPTWEEMCFVKELFFKDDEVVMQLHPPKKANINVHNYCLHLWRPQTEEERAPLLAEFEKELAEETDPEKRKILEMVAPIERAPTSPPIPLPPRAMV